MPIPKADLDAITRKLVDQGKLMEAGFTALRYTTIPADAPPVQIAEMRYAFMAGAQHLFASIMGILEEGREPTSNDLRRVSSISDELDAFVIEAKARARSN